MEKPASLSLPTSPQPPQPQQFNQLLNQPKSSAAYWLGRWYRWQNRRTKAKAKLTANR